MSRFSAVALDLSRVDRSTIFPTLSFEAIRAARLADLKARLQAAGIDYDVETLETDPGAILQEASGYRELLLRQAIYDATASVLLAFSWGEYLDRLGDALRTERLAGEDDARYRARIQLAPEALSTAGTLGGYIYHAVSADVRVRDVAITVLRRQTLEQTIEIVVLSKEGDGAPSAEIMENVRARLLREDIRLVTDAIEVRQARILTYTAEAKLFIRPGPSPALVKSKAEAALRAVADRYKRIGADVPYSGLSAALHVAEVERAELTLHIPTGAVEDVEVLRFQAAHLGDVTLRVETLHG